MEGARRREPRLAVRRFEIYALFLMVGFTVRQLLSAATVSRDPALRRLYPCTTVFGWATGRVTGGIIADYIGRKPTMMLAILTYWSTTALSVPAWNWQSFALLRSRVGVGIGSECVRPCRHTPKSREQDRFVHESPPDRSAELVRAYSPVQKCYNATIG
jgi:hypothetical protein